jgi:hypothetical protein
MLNFFDGSADKATVEVAHGEAGMRAVVEVAAPIANNCLGVV